MDREKVIKGLECHQIDINHRINCADCPYYVDDDNHIRCVNDLHDDAIVLLKKKETQKFFVDESGKVTPLPVVVRCEDCKWWHESKTNKGYGDCGQANGIALKPSDWYCADGERQESR